MNHLRIGIPSKGRLSEAAIGLLKSSGLNFSTYNRSLFARVREMPLDVTFLRADDIPVLCAEGAIDMGITGSDLIVESGTDVGSRLTRRLELGFGRCRLAVCVPESSPTKEVKELHNLRIATSFPTIAKQYLAEHGCEAHVVSLSGSVEVMISLGIADAIVDLVETGSTLAANGLRILAEIGKYECVLIQNKEAREPEVADRVIRRIEGVVIAQSYTLLEYNVARERLAEAEKITPGYNSPTINTLEDAKWCSVRAMVLRKNVIQIMEQLEAIGAHAIMQTEIANCRL